MTRSGPKGEAQIRPTTGRGAQGELVTLDAELAADVVHAPERTSVGEGRAAETEITRDQREREGRFGRGVHVVRAADRDAVLTRAETLVLEAADDVLALEEVVEHAQSSPSAETLPPPPLS